MHLLVDCNHESKEKDIKDMNKVSPQCWNIFPTSLAGVTWLGVAGWGRDLGALGRGVIGEGISKLVPTSPVGHKVKIEKSTFQINSRDSILYWVNLNKIKTKT